MEKKVDHITIMKLGSLEEVTKKANGQDPYVWAKNFVDELNKKKEKEVLILLSTGKLLEIDKKNSFKYDLTNIH